MSYLKSAQLEKSTREKRVCKKCNKNRLIKFFEKPTSLICDECKLKSKIVKKQSNIGKLKKEAETLAKQCAKKRDDYICQKCGKEVSGINAHGSHVIPVSGSQYLRFDLMNIKCLCYHDHMGWWHKNPLEAYEWFKQKFPDRYNYLMENKNKTHSWTRDELKKMIKEYKAILKS